MNNYLIAFGALIAGFVGVWFGGRAGAKSDATKDTLDTADTAKGVKNEIDALDNASVRDRAGDWVRGPGKK